jgi:Ca2+-binding RTX toxin-like protein
MSNDRPSPHPRTIGLVAAIASLLVPLTAAQLAGASVSSDFDPGTGTFTVRSNGDDGISVACAGDGDVLLNEGEPADGPIACGNVRRLIVNGGPGSNEISVRGVTADEFGALTNVEVSGRDGLDLIQGSELADVTRGGAGNDFLAAFLNPADARDVMRGGGGADTLIWNPGDGSDRMEGETGDDTIQVNGGDGEEQFAVNPAAKRGRVLFDRLDPAPFRLNIGTAEDLVLNAAGGNDRITGAEGLARRIRSSFLGEEGNDRIIGTDGRDRLFGGTDNDVLRTKDGAADRVSCGGGQDLARVDRRDEVRGCEQVPSRRWRANRSFQNPPVAAGR